MVSPLFHLLQGLLQRLGAVGPTMTLFPTIEASAPLVSLIGHINYGHIVILIIYLFRINLAAGVWTGFVLFGIRKLYVSMPYRIGPVFIIRRALATIVSRILIHIIMIMGLRHGVCQVTGVLLLLYLLKHLRRPVLVSILHVGDQVFVMFFQPRIEAILLHPF